MTSFLRVLRAALSAIALLALGAPASLRAGSVDPLCRPAEDEAYHADIAVSLRELQRELERCGSNCSAQVRGLHGLGRIDGFALAPKGDVVVFGPRIAPGQPLQDVGELVIALRVWSLRYARVEGRTRYFQVPSLTLEPRPHTINALMKLRPDEAETWSARFCDICRDMQDLVVMGLPHDSTAALKMAIADWTLKSIVSFDLAVPLPGYESLARKRRRQVEEALRDGTALPASSMNRFWFYPGLVTYREQAGGAALAFDRADLVIRQQAQGVAHGGKTLDVDKADQAAAQWACETSRSYREIARTVPQSGFDALARLLRMFAAAKLIVEGGAAERVGLDLSYLLDRHVVPRVTVKREWPGVAHAERVEHRSQDGTRTRTVVVHMPSCGGIEFALDPSNLKRSLQDDPKVAQLAREVLASRPSSAAVAWNIRH